MELIDSLVINCGPATKSVRLYKGDLTAMPAEEAVDLLVVSAFPSDFLATPTSVIGALARKGVSVAELAKDMAEDLREPFFCWLSKSISRHPGMEFDRILCFEPRGDPSEVVRQVFRCIGAMIDVSPPIRRVAMPLLCTGDMGHPPATMLEGIVRNSALLMRRGLPIDVLKIVLFEKRSLKALSEHFRRLKLEIAAELGTEAVSEGYDYDLFISYSRRNAQEKDFIVDSLRGARPGIRLFIDREAIPTGSAFPKDIGFAIEKSRRTIAVLTPDYVASPMCVDEFHQARFLQIKTQKDVLIPLYVYTAALPNSFEYLNYRDCREFAQTTILQEMRTIAGDYMASA